MAKKRQQDFAKVQLKPGRPLKKSKLAPVKFKSKKIVVPKEKLLKIKSEYTIEDCARKLKSTGSERDKCNHLNELNKLIHRKSDFLNTELNIIFETVLNLIRDPHDDVRNIALRITLYVLENTEDSDLRYYAKLLNGQISTVMKNPSQKIAATSTALIDCMIKNHPDLICHNMEILNDLLPSEKPHFTRQPTFERATYLYSETEEINNLGLINTFFKSMLENKRDFTNDEHDKDVYMDVNKPMCLVLYTSGGLKPIDIEDVYSKQFNPQVDPFEQAEKLKHVINVLVLVIPDIFSRTIRCQSSADDNTLRSESISDLSIIAQVLYHMVEIAERRIFDTFTVEQIATIVKEKVYSPYRKRFPFELLSVLPGTSLEPLAMLNTSLSFLFMKFLFSNESSDRDWQLIERHLKKFFAADKTYSSEIKCKCIPLFIKMIQLFSYKKNVPDVIFLLLKQLVFLLKTRINHPNKKKLIDFLYNMSITTEYEFWFESEPIALWFTWLLSHLKENIHKFNRKLMKMICKISNLKHPLFIKYLDFNAIKSLVKHRNDDLKETAIMLLEHMDIDDRTFQQIFNIICLDTYPRKFAVALLRMLNVRFKRSPANEKMYVDYMEFLLNTAVGIYNISHSRFVDLGDNNYTKAVKLIQHGHTFTIVPSLYWKEHSEVFQVCLAHLRNLPGVPVSFMFSKLTKEILLENSIIPIHCALALLKLDKDVVEVKDKHHRHLMLDLNFSCLMTTSVLTHSSMDNEWYKWNICELMNSMALTKKSALRILNLLLQEDFSRVPKPDGLVSYFILRVLKVFIAKELLDYECQVTVEQMLGVLTNLADNCPDGTLKHQPLYIQLYDFLMQC